METTAKPIFPKDFYGNMFLQLRHEVNETVKILEPERKFFITLKSYIVSKFIFFLLFRSLAVGLQHLRFIYVLFHDGCFTCS